MRARRAGFTRAGRNRLRSPRRSQRAESPPAPRDDSAVGVRISVLICTLALSAVTITGLIAPKTADAKSALSCLLGPHHRVLFDAASWCTYRGREYRGDDGRLLILPASTRNGTAIGHGDFTDHLLRSGVLRYRSVGVVGHTIVIAIRVRFSHGSISGTLRTAGSRRTDDPFSASDGDGTGTVRFTTGTGRLRGWRGAGTYFTSGRPDAHGVLHVTFDTALTRPGR